MGLDASALNFGLKTTMNSDEAVARGVSLLRYSLHYPIFSSTLFLPCPALPCLVLSCINLLLLLFLLLFLLLACLLAFSNNLFYLSVASLLLDLFPSISVTLSLFLFLTHIHSHSHSHPLSPLLCVSSRWSPAVCYALRPHESETVQHD